MAARLVFTFEGKRHHTGDLKVREVEDIERVLGVDYSSLRVIGRMDHKLAVMACLIGRDHSEAETLAIIEALTLDEVQDMWNLEDDDLPQEYVDGLPNSEGEPSTPSSSGSPADPSSGPRP